MKFTPFIIALCLFASCDTESDPAPTGQPNVPTGTATGPEQFISFDYIELDKIERISKFRSGIGHDYRDGAESCRSMKHYYQPKGSVDWSAIRIFSPVTGTVIRKEEEWAGTQLWIRPFDHPAYTIIIFHIALLKPLALNDTVTAGTQIGTHIGPQTMSDIAVGYSPRNNWTLISYAEILTDSIFSRYTARGVGSRSDLIISKAARDADPLNCSGETFGTAGTLQNWFVLN
jgi:hypothetical protein